MNLENQNMRSFEFLLLVVIAGVISGMFIGAFAWIFIVVSDYLKNDNTDTFEIEIFSSINDSLQA